MLGAAGALALAAGALPWPGRAATVLRVGPAGDFRTIAEAARRARDGDVVEVAAGEYHGDVAVWLQARLSIRAVDGRATLHAGGRAAEGKGIWVIRNGQFDIEGFDFVGARVPSRNGAGIRFEQGRLTVRDSRFIDNQMGLLTGNHRDSELTVERCEFSGPTDGEHWYHNLYVGAIARLHLSASHSHSGRRGHLVKSRARENVVVGNRLVDGGGNASYELEFPNGGTARVSDNLIEQSVRTDNPAIVSFGAEGYRWPDNRLEMQRNTLVNRAPAGVFVRVLPGAQPSVLQDNLWVGAGSLDLPAEAAGSGNRHQALAEWRGAGPCSKGWPC